MNKVIMIAVDAVAPCVAMSLTRYNKRDFIQK